MKKRNTTPKKLQLAKNTVRQISKDQLGAIAGGPAKPTYACYSLGCDNPNTDF